MKLSSHLRTSLHTTQGVSKTGAAGGPGPAELTLADQIARAAIADKSIGNNVGYTGKVGKFVRSVLGMDGHKLRSERADKLLAFVDGQLRKKGYDPDAKPGTPAHEQYVKMLHLALNTYEVCAFLDASAPALATKLNQNIDAAKTRTTGDFQAAMATRVAIYAQRQNAFEQMGTLLGALGLAEAAPALAGGVTALSSAARLKALEKAKIQNLVFAGTNGSKSAEAGGRAAAIVLDGSQEAAVLAKGLEPFAWVNSRHVVVVGHHGLPFHDPQMVKAIANAVRQQAPGRPVHLVVCSGGESGMAQALAKELGVPVKSYFGVATASQRVSNGALTLDYLGGIEARSAQMFWP